MSLLPPQKDTPQSHIQKSIYNLSRSNICRSPIDLPAAAPETEKRHMKWQWQGIQSIKEKVKIEVNQIKYEQYTNPPIVKEKQIIYFLV